MTVQISVNQIPVITTELLARLYGTETIRIQQNHHENKSRFIEGKHFFKAVGDELRNLRLVLNESQKEPEKNHESVVFTEHAVHGGTYGGQETAGAATERGSVSVA